MNKTENGNIMRIDIEGILRSRMPKAKRFIPRFVVRLVERLICQERLNELLSLSGHLKGADFSRAVLDYLKIKIVVKGEHNLPKEGESQRVIYVSNHPLGGLDGMALIDYLSQVSPTGEVRFVVNDLLMAVEPLQDVFLPINKQGRQSRSSAETLDSAMKGDNPIVIFPAGLCSRRQNGEIKDLKWNKMFVNKAIAYERDIIPIHFSGQNSKFFYIFAQIRTRLRIPVNLEQILLPREVFGNEGVTFEIEIGERISRHSLKGGRESEETARQIKETVYKLSAG